MSGEVERGFDWMGLPVMGMLELAVECPGPDRVLCGSDYTINDPAGVILRVQKADADDRTKELILGDNIARMLAERGVNP
jgi:predicted TIM-barrel fold metal-dependent hydrolase